MPIQHILYSEQGKLTSRVDADHKKYFWAASPNTYKTVGIFQLEKVNSILSFHRANDVKKFHPPPRRRNFDIVRDTSLNIYKKLYRDNDITDVIYFKHIVEIYDIDFKNKKNTIYGDSEKSDIELDELDSEDE